MWRNGFFEEPWALWRDTAAERDGAGVDPVTHLVSKGGATIGVEVDGARVHIQLVNTRPEQVKLDMPVEFAFRRIHTAGGRPNYYWKATPLEADR